MNDQNQGFFGWDDIAENNLFPTGTFEFNIDSIEDGTSQKTGNRMFVTTYTCVAPQECAGMQYKEYYVVGTDEQPLKINPGTRGAQTLKKLFINAQVPQSNQIEQLILSSINARVLLSISQYVQTKGDFAGKPANNTVDYHRLGEREVGVKAQGGSPGQSAVARPTIPVAPPVSNVPAQPAQPVQPIAPQVPADPPVQPAPIQPTQPTQAVPAVPATQPIQQAPPAQTPAAPPAQSQTQANPTEMMMDCTYPGCGQRVAVSQFAEHIQMHAKQSK